MTCTTSYRSAYHQQKPPSSQVTGVKTLRNANFADTTLKVGHRSNKGHGWYNLVIFREDANFQRLGTQCSIFGELGWKTPLNTIFIFIPKKTKQYFCHLQHAHWKGGGRFCTPLMFFVNIFRSICSIAVIFSVPAKK